MTDINDSVGVGGVNNSHDVALIQAMLKVIKDAKGNAYLKSNYDGIFGKDTKAAITSFQTDHKLAAAPGTPGAAKKDTIGLVKKASATLKELSASLPANVANMRILPGTKTVYLEAAKATGKKAHTEITGMAELEASFRGKVAKLVKKMYDDHKIALWVTPSGGRRTFAEQAKLTNTKAGPGESNHNFGRAVDIGFKDIEWLQGNGTVKKDAFWLNTLEGQKANDAASFWDARDAIAAAGGIFPLNFERIHLQAWKHGTVSSARSLATLLSKVGKTQWSAVPGSPNKYKSDLGYGGKTTFIVGTAKQIWAGNATVTKKNIVTARNEVAIAEAKKTGAKALAAFKALKETDIKVDEVLKVKAILKSHFQAADTHWVKWKGVP